MGLARKVLAEGQTCGSKERLVFYLKGNWATASQEGSHPTGQPNVSCENISDSGAGSGVSEEQLCRRGQHPETSSIWVLPPLSAEPAGSGSHSWTPWWTRLMMTAAHRNSRDRNASDYVEQWADSPELSSRTWRHSTSDLLAGWAHCPRSIYKTLHVFIFCSSGCRVPSNWGTPVIKCVKIEAAE